MSPAVSIITPCFNQGALLREAVASVRAQSLPGWEMIIVDDGSTDNTLAIARELAAAGPGSIRVIHQANQGQAQARHAGLQSATGEFLVLLDSDDLLEPDMLAAGIEALAANPAAAAVVGRALLVEPDGRTVIRPIDQNRIVGWPRILNVNPYGALVGGMFRHEAVVQAGGLGFEGVAGCEDWDLWVRLTRARRPFVTSSAVFGRYRRSAGSYSMNVPKMLTSALKVLELSAGPDPRLVAVAVPHPPISPELHATLRNRLVLHHLGKAVGLRASAADLQAILDPLGPAPAPGRHDYDAFVTGLHIAGIHGGRPALDAPALDDLCRRIREAFARHNLPAAFAARLEGALRSPHPQRHFLTRLSARLGKLLP